MCGISALLKPRDQRVDPANLAAMAGSMVHRGPSHLGVHAAGFFGCAHNRLSLLDPSSASHQPFVGPRGVLVYNGEIYNWKELRKEFTED